MGVGGGVSEGEVKLGFNYGMSDKGHNKDAVEAGNLLPPTLGYPVGCVVKHCGWKIPRAGSWRYGLVLAHRDDVCCLQIDFGSYTAWVNPHAMMHLIRVDNIQI